MRLSKLVCASIIASSSTFALMTPVAANAAVSGSIGVHSKYVLRGIFEENDGAAVQGSIDYTNDSGFYLGWWGSSLSYSYAADGSDPYTSTGFENDIYGGFAGEAGGFSYNVGFIQYYYLSVDDSDLTELVLGAGYGPVGIQAQYLLTDGWWGNAGDIYWTVNYSTSLPKDFTFDASLGYYTYNDDDSDNDEKSWTETTEDNGFRHLNLTLSHPVGDTGADMSITYIVAGNDRTDKDYDDTMVMSVTWGFDI